jgi:hypothetical protein
MMYGHDARCMLSNSEMLKFEREYSGAVPTNSELAES